MLTTWLSHHQLRQRDGSQALAFAAKLFQTTPVDWCASYLLGLAHYRVGDWQSAINISQKAFQSDPKAGGPSCFTLALAHGRLGEKSQARTYYDQALRWAQEYELKSNGAVREALRHIREEADAMFNTASRTDSKQDPN